MAIRLPAIDAEILEVKVMHNSFKNMLAVATLITLPLSLSNTLNAEEVQLDKVIAIVNNDVIMQTELDERRQAVYQRMQASDSALPSTEEIIPQIMDQLIKERLQLDMAERYGIRVSDEQVNQTLRMMAQRQDMSFTDFLETVHKAGVNINTLRSQINNEMIIRQLQESAVKSRIRVTEQEIDSFLQSEDGQFWKSAEMELGHIMLPLSSGASKEVVQEQLNKANKLYQRLLSGEDFRELATLHSAGQNALKGGDLGWRRSVQLPAVLSNALNDIPVGGVSKPVRSEAGLHIIKIYQSRGGAQQAVILQHKARHILLKTNELRDDEACYEQLMEMRTRIAAGDKFSELAKEFSEDYSSALSGGDLGWSMPGQFVPEFEQVIESVELAEVSHPFRSQFGWHILQVDERREQDFSGEVLRNQAANVIRDRKFGEELLIWLQDLKDKAYVEIKG